MKPGMMFQFLMFIVTCAAVYYGLQRGRQGFLPPVRKIPGLDAIEEAVGRATEIAKPVYVTPGGGGLSDEGAVQTLAGLAIMSYTVRLCARYQAPFWVSVRQAETFPVTDEMVRDALAAEGRLDIYRDDTVEYYSNEQFAFAMGTLGRMMRDGISAAIIMGYFQAESLLLAEGAAQLGAITIGGCARTSQIAFFVCTCDYTLIGEEMLVGGAYLSKDTVQLGTLWGQDIIKIAGLAFILAGVLARIGGNKFFDNLVKM